MEETLLEYNDIIKDIEFVKLLNKDNLINFIKNIQNNEGNNIEKVKIGQINKIY